jgi:hypothetical protein
VSDDIRLVGIENVEPYPLLGCDDLYAMPAPEFIIDDFLPEGTISGCTSYPGVGKTWLAFEMLRALATGGQFLGHFPAHEGPVLFVGSDASIYDYARQFRRLTLEQFKKLQPDNDSPVDYENPLKVNVRFLIQSDLLFESLDSMRRLINTANRFAWGPLHEVHDEETGAVDMEQNHGFSLIIFDTLSKLTRMNQNDNSQMEDVFRNLRFVSANTNASIMLLHHNAKASEFKEAEDWRGAMAQIGALDCWFQLTPTQADKSIIQVKVKKFRGITPPDFYYKMDVNNGEMSEEPAASLVVVAEPKNVLFDDGLAEAVVQFLRSPVAIGKWFTLKQVSDAIASQYLASEMSSGQDMALFQDRDKLETAVRNRLKAESRRGVPTVRMVGGGNRGRKATFSASLMEQALESDPSLKVEE